MEQVHLMPMFYHDHLKPLYVYNHTGRYDLFGRANPLAKIRSSKWFSWCFYL